MFSDDHGQTWAGGAPQRGGENSLAELSNGTVVNEYRDTAQYAYLWARSDDGGATFSPPEPRTDPVYPDCPGALLAAGPVRGHAQVLAFSHPNTDVTPRPDGRQNMTLSLSVDGGASFPAAVPVYPGPAAYSSLAMLAPAVVGVLYERSAPGHVPIDFQAVYLAAVNLADALGP